MLGLLTVTASIAIVPFFMDGGAPGRMNDSRKMLLRQVHFTQKKMLLSEDADADRRRDDAR